jgi:hypothetical protein
MERTNAEARGPAQIGAGSVPPDDVVDVRFPRWISNVFVLVCCVVAVLIFLLAEVILPKNRQVGREYLPLNYGIWLAFAAVLYLLRFMTIIRIDDLGITAERRKYSIRPTTVPWNEILSCDFVVIRSPQGGVSRFVPVLKDSGGNVLFPNLANLNTASQVDQRRVFQSLKSRFRKLDPDPWEP